MSVKVAKLLQMLQRGHQLLHCKLFPLLRLAVVTHLSIILRLCLRQSSLRTFSFSNNITSTQNYLDDNGHQENNVERDDKDTTFFIG